MNIAESAIPLHDQIRIMRSVRNLNQTQLAQKAGLTLFLVSYFENGHALPTPTQLQDIKTALRWPLRADEAFAILAASDGDESQEESHV